MSTAAPKHRLTMMVMATLMSLGGLAAYATSAHAACSYPDATQVFASWNDQGYYQLAPDGTLAGGGTGWTFDGGAELVSESNARGHGGAEEETAVDLPYGASATSPPFCVDETTPNFRFMMRNIGDRGAKLRVIVTYSNTRKLVKARNSDVHSDPVEGWIPSPSLKLETGDEPEREARITFTVRDSKGEYLVDDLYVDPFARH
jgi:hypothetical protein